MNLPKKNQLTQELANDFGGNWFLPGFVVIKPLIKAHKKMEIHRITKKLMDTKKVKET